MKISLPPEKLRTRIDPESLSFASTGDIPPLRKPLGQDRALQALSFGLKIESHGYNVFLLGQPGAGKQSTATAVIESRRGRTVPDDWSTSSTSPTPNAPWRSLCPPDAGSLPQRHQHLRDGASATKFPKAFSTEAYGSEKTDITRQAPGTKKRSRSRNWKTLANEHGFLVHRSADGLTLIYTRNGEPLNPEEFDKLSEEDQKKSSAPARSFRRSSATPFESAPIDREHHKSVRTLDSARRACRRGPRESSLCRRNTTVSRASWSI